MIVRQFFRDRCANFTRWCVIAVLCSGAVPCANAQYAPAVNGQNGIFAVPSATVGERGRFTISLQRTAVMHQDSGNVLGFVFGVTPFRHLGLTAGLGFDTRDGVGSMRERILVGARTVLLDYTRQRWWNVGAEADLLINRTMDSAADRTYSGRARFMGMLSPSIYFSLEGYAGYLFTSPTFGGLTSKQKTFTWGGGVNLPLIRLFSLMAEYSNGLELNDPTLKSAVVGVRIFPWSDISVTVGYGKAWRADGIQRPMLLLSLTQGTGLLNFRGEESGRSISIPDLVQPSAAMSAGAIDSARGGLPVDMSALAVSVQTDPQITRVLALARPREGVPFFQVVDSTMLRTSLLSLNGDSSRVLQVTGTESATSEGNPDRIAARADLLRVVQASGFPLSRVVFRDQYTAHRVADPIAYALFESKRRPNGFEEVLRVQTSQIAASLDSISSVLSQPTLAHRVHIMLLAQQFGVEELKAAYALEEMIFSQSLFQSYAVDIVFRKVDFGEPLIIVQTAP